MLAALPVELTDLVDRLRRLSESPEIRAALRDQGIYIEHEDDDDLTLSSVGDGVLVREFDRAQIDVDRSFRAQVVSGFTGKLKATFVATVEFEHNADTDGTVVTAFAKLSVPRGRKIGRSAEYVGGDERPFRVARDLSHRQQKLLDITPKRPSKPH